MKLIKITFLLILTNNGLIQAQEPYFISSNENIPLSATTINSMDVESADVDGDGDLDIVIAGEFSRNLLFFNDGSGVFSEDSSRLFPEKNTGDGFAGEDSEDIDFADFNQDGNLDIIFVSEDTNFHELLINDGEGLFTFIPYEFPPSLGNAVAVMDLNGDTYPDIIIGNTGQNQVYINNQDLTFNQENNRWPVNTEGTQDLKLIDLDNDGDLDIIEGIDLGTNNILINNNGFFIEENNRLPDTGLTLETRKITLGDVNNDGFLDIFVSTVNFIGSANFQNRIYLNNGDGFFTDVTVTHLPVYMAHTLDAVFYDYDNDGDLDLLTTDFQNASGNYHAFENDSTGIFTESTITVFEPFDLINGVSLHMADFNNDGFNDLYFGNYQEADDILFFSEEALGLKDISSLDKIKIYPNPTTDVLSISSENTVVKSLSVYSITGKKIVKQIVKTNSIDVSDLSNGMYFLEVISEKGKSYHKFIKK
ncbi:MAG: FG-GAP-like repeat-containing protein [Flavobacteriales bacterium]